ncbi:hypothetical protein FRX31_004429 [Thalictrum thalictroides]|uniref:Transposase MuDR plant domain-containing protein n=1 Tax=Thalictrum thalictroides TaxID=46969 RepID=A0A7J6X881_THATH|nr:hypothetical protein FRX31_004429 [Thalictrum thalictroides]
MSFFYGFAVVIDDLEWIKKTSRIDDFDSCEWLDVNLDEENLPVLEVDQRWYNIYKCRSYLKTYAISRKFVLVLNKNDSDRIQASCKGVGPEGEACTWYCSIGRMTDMHTMRVGVLNKEHTCVSYELIVNPTATAPWIAEQVESDMRMHHRTYKARNIMSLMILSPLRPDWKMYCSHYFTVECYKLVYSGTIKPILHETDWGKSTEMEILPPIRPRAPGRPPVSRRRGIDEGPAKYNCKKQFRCGICKGYGHNKLTCPGGGPNYAAMMAAMETAKKGATPAGGRPRTRLRKPIIGEPLEAAYAAAAEEEMMEQEQHMETEAGRGRGRGRGKGKEFYMRPPPPPGRHVLRPSTFTSNELRNPRVFNSTLASLLGFNRHQENPSQWSSEGSNNIASQRGTNASQPSQSTQQSKTTKWMPKG